MHKFVSMLEAQTSDNMLLYANDKLVGGSLKLWCFKTGGFAYQRFTHLQIMWDQNLTELCPVLSVFLGIGAKWMLIVTCSTLRSVHTNYGRICSSLNRDLVLSQCHANPRSWHKHRGISLAGLPWQRGGVVKIALVVTRSWATGLQVGMTQLSMAVDEVKQMKTGRNRAWNKNKQTICNEKIQGLS